jgi:hypothetical protein
MNKVVARFQDGRVLKGHTADFVAAGDTFHIARADAPSAPPHPVLIADLKAVFFVKDFTGNPLHDDHKMFAGARPASGRKLRIEFKDGEVMVGTTQTYEATAHGFFLVPADAASNIERCFVVAAATEQVILL